MNDDKKRNGSLGAETKSRVEEIRGYGLSEYAGSAGSALSDIKFLLSLIDKLVAKVKEAQAAQAHTASCNIELLRKLDKRDEALRGLCSCRGGKQFLAYACGVEDTSNYVCPACKALGEEFGAPPEPSRCKHDVHGIDCVKCYPTEGSEE